MRKMLQLISLYILVIGLIVGLAVVGNRTATDLATQAPIKNRQCVIIDAGHGGIDGGATSCTGVLESKLNLEISARLNDLLHLLGISTLMIRTDDRSVYTSGQTIAAKKVSDLKERVRIINSTSNAVLISIHQNHFTDSRYDGAQVFYASTDRSKEIAGIVQNALKEHLKRDNNRDIKKADCIYLLDKINCTGILIECGFLSNPVEEAKLRTPAYQQKLCSIIGSALSRFLSNA